MYSLGHPLHCDMGPIIACIRNKVLNMGHSGATHHVECALTHVSEDNVTRGAPVDDGPSSHPLWPTHPPVSLPLNYKRGLAELKRGEH